MWDRPTSAGGAGAAWGATGTRASRVAASEQSWASRRAVGKARPRIGRVGTGRAGELLHLCAREQRGVVRRMSLRGQPPRLDRVREDHRRPIGYGVRPRERLEQIVEVVTAEIPDRAQQFLVVELGDQPDEVPFAAAGARKSFAQLARRRPQQPLEFLVGHLVDPATQRVAARAREQLAQPAPVLDGDRLPAGRLEHPRDPARGDVRDDSVERLAVEVDDPQHLAEARHDRVDQRLPDRPLVELGVTQQRDLAASLRDLEVARHVAVRDGAPDRRGRSDPHRAGGEVGGHRILQPARVALQPTELTQRRQVFEVQLTEQILDRVEDRGGVRLHRHSVGPAQMLEPERGHDRHDRRRGRLMTADLHARTRLPHPVGVIHDRSRQPEHPVLDCLEHPEPLILAGRDRHATIVPRTRG